MSNPGFRTRLLTQVLKQVKLGNLQGTLLRSFVAGVCTLAAFTQMASLPVAANMQAARSLTQAVESTFQNTAVIEIITANAGAKSLIEQTLKVSQVSAANISVIQTRLLQAMGSAMSVTEIRDAQVQTLVRLLFKLNAESKMAKDRSAYVKTQMNSTQLVAQADSVSNPTLKTGKANDVATINLFSQTGDVSAQVRTKALSAVGQGFFEGYKGEDHRNCHNWQNPDARAAYVHFVAGADGATSVEQANKAGVDNLASFYGDREIAKQKASEALVGEPGLGCANFKRASSFLDL